MIFTEYHAKYFAFDLSKRCPADSVEKIAAALVDAQVDLNPHQVDAALFAFTSPLSKGALLADEVGLGKTIEAGLVLSQKWAERKRRILIITPSNLRKQWYQELTEKFFLPCRILESKSYNTAIKQGVFRPFEGEEIVPLVQEFTPEESEDRLYQLVSDYLQRDNLQALPASQRTLMTLVLRKLLASSSFAIAGALTSLANRLKDKLQRHEPAVSLEDELDQDYEALGETADEWNSEEPEPSLSEEDRTAIVQEISDLEAFTDLALSIDHNAKGRSLISALEVAFAKAAQAGAAQKAIIFTESRRTQSYLLRLLVDSNFSEGIVLFNGANTDERSKAIYFAWHERHQGSEE